MYALPFFIPITHAAQSVLQVAAENGDLRKDNTRLKRLLEDLRAGTAAQDHEDRSDNEDGLLDSADETGTSRSKKRVKIPSAAERREADIKRRAKKLVVVGMVWAPTPRTQSVKRSSDDPLELAIRDGVLDVAPDPLHRYNTFENQSLTLRWELTLALGEDVLNDYGSEAWLYTLVRSICLIVI